MAWFVVHIRKVLAASRSSSTAHIHTHIQTGTGQATIRANETVACLCLETKGIHFFFPRLVFPTKSRPALEISSLSRHIKQDHRLPFSKSSVLLVYNVPRQGCTVRNHPHLISQSQLCQHSATCVVEAGWLTGRDEMGVSLTPEELWNNYERKRQPPHFIQRCIIFFPSYCLDVSSIRVGLNP